MEPLFRNLEPSLTVPSLEFQTPPLPQGLPPTQLPLVIGHPVLTALELGTDWAHQDHFAFVYPQEAKLKQTRSEGVG